MLHHLRGGLADAFFLGGRSDSDIPPRAVAVGHGLRKDLQVKEAGNRLLSGILQCRRELFDRTAGVGLHAVSFPDLRVIHRDQVSAGLFPVRITELGRQGADAMGHFQVVDAAEAAVVKDEDIGLDPLLHDGSKL